MAVTSLWRVKGYIGKVLLYAENPDKTTNPEVIRVADNLNRNALEDVIAYAGRESATAQKQFVWGINCTPETAHQEMMAVKQQFEKTDGTIAYHGYQSFREGEVTPEQAHQIGIQMAQELWGDRYQVLVATHLDAAISTSELFQSSPAALMVSTGSRTVASGRTAVLNRHPV